MKENEIPAGSPRDSTPGPESAPAPASVPAPPPAPDPAPVPAPAPASAPAPDSAPVPARAPVPAPEPAPLTIDEFARVELRVATVVAAEPHPNADRLLKLQIDLGTEHRQLVAGIAAWYRPEDLVGTQIVVVANLKPAKLRGELSQGMLLAASAGDIVSILRPDRELPPGSTIR